MDKLEETTPLVANAIRLNEVYKSLLEGGFTSDEALSLIAKMTKPNE
jgi:hypothetical protein